ncbi:MAG: FIST C-terminal domain-containing protein [Clostridiales bacterium]|jgi:hypothetical protein|nr:FIST C-terminal domain-containing protein [Clostridiales bacterium]
MIRTLVACTAEIDDADQAVAEIARQLDLKSSLLKSAVAIVACHYEFVLSGVAKAICGSLPFSTVGTITSAQAVPGECGGLLFTLMVLTSDDVEFAPGLTPSLLGGASEQAIEQSYRDAVSASGAGPGERPALIFAFAPFIIENSGDTYVGALTRLSGGVPCFGTLAVDDTNSFANCFMLYDGEQYRDRMGMVLLFGDVSPQFCIATISENKIVSDEALVTKSAGHVLIDVNNRPVLDYFEKYGLTKAAETQYAMTSLPFMLDYGDGTPPVSKVFISLTPEGHAICASMMPEGARMKIGVFDRDDVLLTTSGAIDSASACMAGGGASGALIYSCISRNMTLGANQTAEMELVGDRLRGAAPYMMAYSGGEICPTQVSGAGAVNRFHNNAFVMCIF